MKNVLYVANPERIYPQQMSFLLEKSKENHEAFIRLKEHQLLSPAVHCGYYSCIQKIMYILKEHYTEEYNAEMKQYASRQKGNLHKMNIDLFCAQFQQTFKESSYEVREMKHKFKELKSLRLASDYEEQKITVEQIKKVDEYTNKIHGLIKKYMNI